MGGETNGHERAREGLQHLQAAAHELIQAARALLDVAEDLVDDPASVATLVGIVGALRDGTLRDAARRPGAGHGRSGDAGDAADDEVGPHEDDAADRRQGAASRIERITVA